MALGIARIQQTCHVGCLSKIVRTIILLHCRGLCECATCTWLALQIITIITIIRMLQLLLFIRVFEIFIENPVVEIVATVSLTSSNFDSCRFLHRLRLSKLQILHRRIVVRQSSQSDNLRLTSIFGLALHSELRWIKSVFKETEKARIEFVNSPHVLQEHLKFSLICHVEAQG